MKIPHKNPEFQKKAKPLAIAAFFGILLFPLALYFISMMIPKASADTASLQESVEMEQANYNISIVQARESMKQHCETWKSLATAKRGLANATGLHFNLSQEQIDSVKCESAQGLVPAGF